MIVWVEFHVGVGTWPQVASQIIGDSVCGDEAGTEASCPAQEHGTVLGAPGAQLVLPASPLFGGEPGP